MLWKTLVLHLSSGRHHKRDQNHRDFVEDAEEDAKTHWDFVEDAEEDAKTNGVLWKTLNRSKHKV